MSKKLPEKVEVHDYPSTYADSRIRELAITVNELIDYLKTKRRKSLL